MSQDINSSQSLNHNIPVQDCTTKPAKQPKIRFSKYKQNKDRGSRLPGEIWEDSHTESHFNYMSQFIESMKVLPEVRRENKPKFDSIYKRKFMCLAWLLGDQQKHGFLSVYGIVKYYALKDNTWADKYFTRLINENWILPIDTHMLTHRRAVLSPLFFSLIQSITNTLRREYPERFKAQDLAALSPEIKAMKPESSVFDFVTAIPDLR